MLNILIEELEGALWALALDNKHKIQAIEIDTPLEQVRWGDIYQARVKTIDAARDAAFVDIGGGLTGLLYNKNIRTINQDGSITKGGGKSIGHYLKAGQNIIVQAKTAYIESGNDRYVMEHKIPEVSMDISLQGRYLIYCPRMRENRLSSRITDKKLAAQIQDMLTSIDSARGFIVRAASVDTQIDILMREMTALKDGWQKILETAIDDSPQLIASGLDSTQRMLSDLATTPINAIEVVTMDHLHHAEHWCSIFAPDLVPKITPVELDDGQIDLALFVERDVLTAIEDLQKPYCQLPSGGNLIIQPAAALTAIDVNKASDARSRLDTNLEAVTEALRQIKLRNLGGVIMIDALNMKGKKEKDAFLKVARTIAAKDPCTVQIHGLTCTGLLEITRKRRTATLTERLPQGMFAA